MFFKKLYLSLLVSLGLSSAVIAGPIINQHAADLSPSSYTASSTYLSAIAENAFNGTGDWNSGIYGWAWIQADMGEIKTITEIKIQTAQSPNGATQHQVFLSDTFIGAGYGSLTPIFSRSGATTHGTIIDAVLSAPQTGRFLLILAHGGASWTALGSPVRVNWTQPLVQTTNGGSNPTSVPEPDMMLLLALGLMGIGYARKRKLNHSATS